MGNIALDEVAQRVAQNWKETALKLGQKAGNYLYGFDRCAVAHIENKKKQLSNPDDLTDLNRINRDVHIIQGLAKLVFDKGLLE